MSIYSDLDEWSRTATMFLAENVGLGMGGAILAISWGIKLLFVPFQLKMQVQGVKMRLIAPEMKAITDKMKKLQNSGDYKGAKAEREKLTQLRKEHGIGGFSNFIGLLQIPILITWFLSLRHMAMNPDLYPRMLTDGYLWFKNLSDYDPYFILPMLSAILSAMNISVHLKSY